uniref:Uncharacterized protein n=1 Tax=Anguilla anguilla TaxID=7936 RepID=A0A0E9WH61_ANGAN
MLMESERELFTPGLRPSSPSGLCSFNSSSNYN